MKLESLIHSSLNLSVTRLYAFLLGFTFILAPPLRASSSTTYSVVHPCSAQEQWDFEKHFSNVPVQAQNDFILYLEGKTKPMDGFSKASKLRAVYQDGKLVSKFADYWMARSLLDANLEDLAVERFNSLIESTVPKYIEPIQIAAIECVQVVHRNHPYLTLSKQAELKLPAFSAGPVIWEAAMQSYLSHFSEKTAPPHLKSLVKFFKGSGVYEDLANVLNFIQEKKNGEASYLLGKVIDAKDLPQSLVVKKNELRLLRARIAYEAEKYEDSVKFFESIEKSSNALIPALTSLSWAYLMKGSYPQSVGTAVSLQMPRLRNTFAPEAFFVTAVAMNELCLYADALRTVNQWKKTYHADFLWLEAHQAAEKKESEKIYPLALRFLNGKDSNVPERIGTEWLRSPIFANYQEGINFYFDRMRKIENLVTDAKVTPGANTEWLKLLDQYAPQAKKKQLVFTGKIESELANLNRRMYEDLNFVAENLDLLDAEIASGASKDIVWQNANPEYVEMVKNGTLSENRTPASSAARIYDWGEASSNLKETDELWEDEIGSMQTRLANNCQNKELYLKIKQKRSTK